MIVNLDSKNPKSIEQKVNELILKKLYIKVNDELIFIEKETFISLILRDIIVLATSDFDLDTALSMSLELQPEYKADPHIKRNELEEASNEFAYEIDAYRFFLEAVDEKMPEDDIYDDVLSILNSEHELLEKRLHELMMESLGKRLSEEDAISLKTTRHQILDVFANQVKLLATYEDIDDVVDEAYSEFENYPQKDLISKESIKNEYLRFAPLAKIEIDTYKMALNLEEQNAEFPMILACTRKMLQLE